jgi:hypothetical protein
LLLAAMTALASPSFEGISERIVQCRRIVFNSRVK